MSTSQPARAKWWNDPLSWVEVFIVGNIGFLALDIFIAHSMNQFAEPAEWVPIVFSAAAPALLVVGMLLGGLRPKTRGGVRMIGMLVGWAAVAVGLVGFVLHLESQFFELLTLKSLVYTAPFVAPLAYTGLGLLLLLNRMVDSESIDWARWVVLLALGGFFGNFVLTLADHAQNGFFRPSEWIAVAASAFAVSSLLAVMIVPRNRPLILGTGIVMIVQIGVGLLGAGLHAHASLGVQGPDLWDKLVYGAPLFAPLLFANMAVLALIALWALLEAAPARSAALQAEPSREVPSLIE